MVTTSRNASNAVKAFARQFAAHFGNSFYSRGSKGIEEIVNDARYQGFQKIVIVSKKNEEFELSAVEIDEEKWVHGESFSVKSMEEGEKALLSK